MTAPLNRDQQIELMQNAEVRHLDRFSAWMSVRVIREAISRPAPGQDCDPAYSVEDTRIACCG